jgi:uncharacterized protein
LRPLCLAIAVFAGCAYNSTPDAKRVKVEVAHVGVDREGTPFVLLEDSSGQRMLPIMIGESEAQGIALQLQGLNPGRPLTYDLIRNLLDSTGNHVDWVEVNDVRDQTYYAVITLNRGHNRVDSRPSDAIAVALATNAPIYVATKLLESSPADVQAHGQGPRTVHALGLTVQEITPDIASYFAAKAGAALLVADVSDEASRAGIARGDLLTKVGADQVGTLKDFNDDLRRLKPQQQVTVTIEHDGHNRSVSLKMKSGAH